MKIICLVKVVPDVESFKYDYGRNALVRENVHQLINPEDATALAIALEIKRLTPGVHVETVSMAPQGAMPHLEDLVRRGVDLATLISDSCFAGSDTYATSRILARYLSRQAYDCIFAGTCTIDGGTAQVPAQIAEELDIAHLANIAQVEAKTLSSACALVDIDDEDAMLRFEVALPAVLGFQYSTKHKLPYIPYEAMNLDTSDSIRIVTNDELGFDPAEVGHKGSLTFVANVEVKTLEQKDTLFVRPDEAGVEEVYRFLSRQGYLRS
jgi:electron transfer flavoprotein beta subunit